jgi:large exoprotein involved in heme utilization and adhesion
VEKDSFTVSGKGGLPEDPNALLRGSTTWTDLRPLSVTTAGNSPRNQSESSSSPETPQIIEAQGWIVGDRGQIILTAYPTHTTAMEPNSAWEECQ